MKKIRLVNGGWTLVSESDFLRFDWFSWRMNHNGYVERKFWKNGKCQRVFLHREILGAKRGQIVDHRDGDRLNNTRENIRICSAYQNCCNTRRKHGMSRFKGVSWNKDRGAWAAQIGRAKKNYHLGYFKDEEDAAVQYDIAAILFHGQDALLNFPKPDNAPETIKFLHSLLLP